MVMAPAMGKRQSTVVKVVGLPSLRSALFARPIGTAFSTGSIKGQIPSLKRPGPSGRAERDADLEARVGVTTRDGAAHALHQPTHQRQAYAGALVLARQLAFAAIE